MTPARARPFASWAKSFAATWAAQQRAAEGALGRVMLAFFRDQAEGVAEEVLKHGAGATAEAILRPEWEQAFLSLAREVLERLCLQGAVTEFSASGGKRFAPLVKAAEDIEALRLKLPDAVKLRVDAFLDTTFKQPFWGEITAGVRDDLAKALKAAQEAGDNLQESAKRVQAALTEAGRGRAETIARTESTGSLNSGHQAVREHLHDLGLIKGKQWVCVLDGDTRPEHRAAHEQTVGVHEDFTVGGERCSYPGDQRLTPANRVNCRCAVLSVLKGAEEL